ncbi:hypothetical protein [Desulfovibrio sp. MES5]|uniref:hypothetical protein n=1 Tax=Desulfovibrio sp. MES5 TaxID=1899016 RepID=UPI0025BB502D|nr:hypothetical protein [Desulfovibrio sp. MES5]
MKQFLRFQIVGMTFFFWMALFLIPYFNNVSLTQENGKGFDTFFALLTSVGLSSPIGILLHQISISIASPFRKKRLFLFKREVTFKDNFSNAKYVLSKSLPMKAVDDYKIEYIVDEITNRYSYYYVRIDNGFFAPLFGYILSNCTLYLAEKSNWSFLKPDPIFSVCWIILFAVLIFISAGFYIPTLFKEINELEIFLYEKYEHYAASLVNGDSTS